MAAISVLTLVKGRHVQLERLMEGLARSAEPPGELIVVNMDAVPLSLARQPYSVRVIELAAGSALPLAAARNQAAAAAQHRMLLFLDVDCIVSARTLGLIGGAFQGEDCMLCPQVLYLPANATTTAWTQDSLRRVGMAHPSRQFPPSGMRHEPNPGFLWSVAVATRAATFYRLGGFDEQFTGYGAEDTDLGFKAQAHGLRLIYQSGAPVFHQHHPVFRPPLQHFPAIVRNAALFHAKWQIWPMQEHLDAFAAAGLLARGSGRLTILRYPTTAEIAAARMPDTVLF